MPAEHFISRNKADDVRKFMHIGANEDGWVIFLRADLRLSIGHPPYRSGFCP